MTSNDRLMEAARRSDDPGACSRLTERRNERFRRELSTIIGQFSQVPMAGRR
jgi:hypothetical protein